MKLLVIGEEGFDTKVVVAVCDGYDAEAVCLEASQRIEGVPDFVTILRETDVPDDFLTEGEFFANGW